jgi:ABC-2 type transport system ATP-binding protein
MASDPVVAVWHPFIVRFRPLVEKRRASLAAPPYRAQNAPVRAPRAVPCVSHETGGTAPFSVDGDMLEATQLTKRYNGLTALDALNLTVEPGEVFCLLGANGAGKTTTINLFLNFIEPTSGRATINGLDVTTHALETKKYVAYIPETVMLYRNLTGLENIEYFAALAGRPDYAREQLLGFFRQVGLSSDVADRRVGTYSKGMRQKVGIAIAIAKGARALLLDEPTSGLDPKASNEFSDLLKRLSTAGVAILMATHDLFRAKESGTRVGIMKHGTLVAVHGTHEFNHADLERLYLEHMHD